MTGSEVEVLPRPVREAVAYWRPASMVPAAYIDKKTDTVRVDDLRLACSLLHAMDVDPLPNLPDTYVVNGRVGFMAALQRALLPRAGYQIQLLSSDAEHATARIRTPDGWQPPMTFTRADATRAGLMAKDTYKQWPQRMFEARVTTALTNFYAPGILRGLAAPAAGIAGYYDGDDIDPATGEILSGSDEESGEGLPGPESPTLMVPPRSVAPSGATIPEHLREPEVDSAVRVELLARILALDEATRAELADICKALCLPNIRTVRFTRAHGALLDRLITEAISGGRGYTKNPGPAPSEPAAAGAIAPPREAPAGPGPTDVPDDVYDDSTESHGYDPDLQPASYDDPDDDGRPFGNDS